MFRFSALLLAAALLGALAGCGTVTGPISGKTYPTILGRVWGAGYYDEMRRRKYLRSTNAPRHIKDAIAANRLCLGMTPKQAVLVRGRPRSINRTVTAAGVHEQWVYGGYMYEHGTYAYFDNGILTAIQTY